ncbi:hypothetical protein GJ744_007172 [Endocarpon pusillum]|uniref:Uncharacterized protein n=1 Tax=Endocarpon pusillum TaxID=364733 RepID=A0A8H7AJ60_9EURO|nr:hypothetical protein GJ744_007172 [Endocarpon pusillum]
MVTSSTAEKQRSWMKERRMLRIELAHGSLHGKLLETGLLPQSNFPANDKVAMCISSWTISNLEIMMNSGKDMRVDLWRLFGCDAVG